MNKISQVLTERWSINDAEYASLLLPLLSALKAGNIEAVEKQLAQNQVTAYAVTPGATPYLADKYELDDMNLPINSVAVITMEGPLYAWETYRLEERITQAVANPKIIGIVLWINGPGGMIAHLDIAAKAVEECPKPIATYVANTMASAHFWIGTAAQRIFIASPMCMVGSVGIMTQYFDTTGYLKSLGIDVRDIYPDSADLKNYTQRQIHDKNNDEPLKEELTKAHMIFCQEVARHLGVEYDPKLELFRGKLFSGDEALELGYVDQIGTLQDAVMWVFAKGLVSRANQR